MISANGHGGEAKPWRGRSVVALPLETPAAEGASDAGEGGSRRGDGVPAKAREASAEGSGGAVGKGRKEKEKVNEQIKEKNKTQE